MVGYAGLVAVIYVVFFRTDYKRLNAERETEFEDQYRPAPQSSSGESANTSPEHKIPANEKLSDDDDAMVEQSSGHAKQLIAQF